MLFNMNVWLLTIPPKVGERASASDESHSTYDPPAIGVGERHAFSCDDRAVGYDVVVYVKAIGLIEEH
jgi:hypothetical protein